MTDAPSAATASPRAPRRRAIRRVVVVLAVVLVMLAIAPLVAAPYLRARVESELAARTGGRARLDELSFGWGGGVRVAGLQLDERDGRALAAVERVDVSLDLLAAIVGRYEADVVVRGVELHVRRDPDGRLNLARLAQQLGGPDADTDRDEDDDDDDGGDSEPPPRVRAQVDISDVTVAIHDPRDEARATRLDDVRATFALEDLTRPASFSAALALVGPDGPGGSMSLDGEVTLAEGGVLGPQAVRGHVLYALDGVRAQSLGPALAALAGVDDVRGAIEGDGRWELVGPLALAGRGGLTLTGAAFRLGDEEVTVPDASLSAEATLDDVLSGTQTLALDVGPALTLRYEGTTRTPTGARGTLAGTWTASGRVGPLLELLAPWVPVRQDLSLAGELALEGALDAGLQDGVPRRGGLRAGATLSGLSAQDASGAMLELGELRDVRLALDAHGDLDDGTLAVRDLLVAAGPVTVSGTLGLAGLALDAPPASLRLDDSNLRVQADLDRLGQLVTPLLDLPGLRLGGRVDATADARQDGTPVDVRVDVDVSDLLVAWPRAGQPPLAFGPLALAMQQEARLDASAQRLELRAFAVSAPFLDVTASGAFTDVFAATARGALEASVLLRPEAATLALGGLLGGWALHGEPLRGAFTLGMDAETLSLTTSWSSPRLGLAGGPLAGPLDVEALSLSARGAFAPASGTLDVPELELTSSLFTLAGEARLENLAAPDAGLTTTATLGLAGDVEPLRAALAGFVPELASARAAGSWRFDLDARHEADVNTLRPVLALRDANLSGFVLDGRELPLRDVALDLVSTITLDASGTGHARFAQTSLTAPGVALRAEGELSGFLGDAAPEGQAGLELDVDPGEVGTRMAAFLGGLQLAGDPIAGTWTVARRGARTEIAGDLQGDRLAIGLPPEPAPAGGPVAAEPGAAAPSAPPRTLVQRDLRVRVDAVVDATPGADTVTLREVRYGSSTGAVAAEGTLGGFLTPATMRAELDVTLSGELARVTEDLAALLPLEGTSLAGQVEQVVTVRGDAGRLRVQSEGGITDLRARVEPGTPGGAPLVVEDPRVGLSLAADVQTEALDVVVESLAVDATFLEGSLDGRLLGLAALGDPDAPTPARVEALRGRFTYVPDRLGAILGPWLPVPWRGNASETIELAYDGDITDLDPVALLRAATADVTLGLGTFSVAGIDVSGPAHVTVVDERVETSASLKTLGGAVTLDAALDLRAAGTAEDPVRSTLTIGLDALRAGGKLGGVLDNVHPLFANASSGASVSALLGGGLQVALEGPLPAGLLDALDLSALPLAALHGEGSLDMAQLSLASSPLLSQMLTTYGLGTSAAGEPLSLDVEPMRFTLEAGRLAYREPWAWTIGGIATTFTGGLGLDESIDMAWNIPVTDAFVARYDELEPLLGEVVSIPIRGSLRAPRLDLDGVFGDLVTRAAKRELQGSVDEKLKEKLGEELGGQVGQGDLSLEGVIGGVLAGKAAKDDDDAEDEDEDAPADPAEPADPAQLLKRADRLWDKGEQDKAAELYRELRRDHKDSAVFEEAKERIRERAKHGTEGGG